MSEENVFREVDEELRRERMRGLWQRYGIYIIGAAIAVVLVVAASEGWNWWHQRTAAESSDRFYAALDLAKNGDVDGARKALDDIAANGSGQYPLLARFREAGLLSAQGKTDDAVAAYDAIAGQAPQQRLRELALVLAAYELVDSGDVTAVESRIGTLASSESPLRNTAREAIGLAQYKAGDLEAAKKTFDVISKDPQGSLGQLRRVQLYIAQLTAEGVDVPDDQIQPVTEAVPAAAPAETAPAETTAPNAAPAETQAPASAPAAPADANSSDKTVVTLPPQSEQPAQKDTSAPVGTPAEQPANGAASAPAGQ